MHITREEALAIADSINLDELNNVQDAVYREISCSASKGEYEACVILKNVSENVRKKMTSILTDAGFFCEFDIQNNELTKMRITWL